MTAQFRKLRNWRKQKRLRRRVNNYSQKKRRKEATVELRAWRRVKKLSVSDCGRLFRCRPQVVHKWLTGSIPDPKYMRRIFRVTHGEVRPDDFYHLPDLDAEDFNDADDEDILDGVNSRQTADAKSPAAE